MSPKKHIIKIYKSVASAINFDNDMETANASPFGFIVREASEANISSFNAKLTKLADPSPNTYSVLLKIAVCPALTKSVTAIIFSFFFSLRKTLRGILQQKILYQTFGIMQLFKGV